MHLGKKEPKLAEKYIIEAYQQRKGNVPGLAESSNALALSLMYQERLQESKSWFDHALDLNLRSAHYRGAGQQCLNLIRWSAKSIANSGNPTEAEKFFVQGNKFYDDAKRYWKYLHKRNPPELESLERELRFCELLFEYILGMKNKYLKRHYFQDVMPNLEKLIEKYRQLKHTKKIDQCIDLKLKFQKLSLDIT